MTDAEVRKPVPAWIWGGALLAASAVVPTAMRAVAPGGLGSAVAIVTAVLFAASLVIFAFGFRDGGSVVDRRRTGVVALLVLAVVPFVMKLATSGPIAEDQIPLYTVVSYVQLAVTAAAALVAVVTTGRVGVLPPRWRWAPAWGLAVIALAVALPQVVGVAMAGRNTQDLIGVFTVASLLIFAVPLTLGVLAMLLGARGLATPSPQVYPPAQ